MERLPVYETRNAPRSRENENGSPKNPQILEGGQKGRTSFQLIKLSVPTGDGKSSELLELIISGNGQVKTDLINEYTSRFGEPTNNSPGGYVQDSINKELTILSWPTG